MEKKDTQHIGALIREYLKVMRIDGKIRKARIINSWEKIVGKTIAKATKNIYFRGSTLIIELNSSVIRNELQMLNEKLISLLNEKAGEKVVEKVILK